MEQTECSEMSAYKIQTPRNYPEESIQHSEQGESLKSRIHYSNFRQLTCSQSDDIRCCIDTIRSPEDEQHTAQNM